MQGKRRGMINVFIVTWCDVEVDKAFRENKDMAE
jgi:hypothetical protein